jgi:membrane associated rhomboid family serine protease
MNNRRYYYELGAAFALYAGLLVASNLVDDALHVTGGARIALALTPMIGAAAAGWAVMRALWRMDELQRRIQLDAIAISFLATALITFGWGFAEEAGAPRLSAFFVWPVMAVCWLIGLLIARRRYL